MFRKFQDRIVAAASNALGMSTVTTADTHQSSSTTTFPFDKIQRLQGLGNYSTEQIISALQTSNGNIDRAAEILLTQGPSMQQQQEQPSMLFSTTTPTPTTTTTTPTTTSEYDEDMELQEALQQSLAVQQQQQQQQQQPYSQPPPPPPRSARTEVMNQAATAALRRAEQQQQQQQFSNRTNNIIKKKATATSKATTTTTTTSTTMKSIPTVPPVRIATKSQHILQQYHPNVKIIPKLQDKTIEEQVVRSVDRMKQYPAAIDTLYKLLSLIYNHHENMEHHRKYRRIDTSTLGYQRSVANVPGAADFLHALHFYKDNNNAHILILSDPMYDPALIYLGWSALQQIQLSSEYIIAKKHYVFQKEVTALLEATELQQQKEQEKKNYYLSKVPLEPPMGRSGASLLQIHITDTYKISRRFDSDDTLRDVLYWMAGTVGITIYEGLTSIVPNKYQLIDMNQPISQQIPFDVSSNIGQNYTLQYLNCWPSGRLKLQPNMDLS